MRPRFVHAVAPASLALLRPTVFGQTEGPLLRQRTEPLGWGPSTSPPDPADGQLHPQRRQPAEHADVRRPNGAAGVPPLVRHADGFAAGAPAVIRNTHGTGAAWYVGTQPSVGLLDELTARWLDEAGVPALLTEPVEGVEAVVRGQLLFVLNHTGEPVDVPLAGGAVRVPARDVVVRPL